MTVVTNPARTNSDDEIESGRESAVGGEYGGHDAEDHARLYDDEKQSDIVFEVGINGDNTWRYPGHRRVLAATSPVFAALLSCKTDVIVVDYIDRRGFEQLLRYHYCEPTQLNSVGTARCALDAAYKFLCPPLAERCARRLDEMLDAGVALEILRDLRFLCARLPGAASAPPLPALSDDAAARSLAQCSRWCDSLAHNALLVLDDNADTALTDERLEELTYEDLALIVKRDTLRVSSELVLAEALSRWSTAACKRTKRELTPAHKRAALGALGYCPRYLLLSGEELDRALALELLEPMERALVTARARKLSAPVPVGAEQEALLRHWARPRPTEPAALPVHLSPRSEPPAEDPQPSKLCARRPKRPKQPSFAPEEKRKKRGCCACFGEGILRAIICLFD
ncbi:BTB/POZ domain-containing protein axundead [Anticarsia gemmatalis]|uniref:BTB/POZ domain-containing protein axundead n=1 Tax=Anticarsia gemmatalis TaxID=129554 RepID=UPI003F76F69D